MKFNRRDIFKTFFGGAIAPGVTFTRNIGVGDYKRDAGDKAV